MKACTFSLTALLVSLLLFVSSAARAETIVNPTAQQVELLYRYFNGDAPDFESLARNSDAVRGASEFDRQAALEHEVARIKDAYSAMQKVDELVVSFVGAFFEYDAAKGGFPLDAFNANTYLPYRSGYGIKFDNYAEFATWKLDQNAARAILLRINNNRSILYTVRIRPFATEQNGGRYIRAQIRGVTLTQNNTQNVLADIKSPSPPRAIANVSTVSNMPPIAPEKLEIRGLHVGATGAEFTDWLASNNLFGEKLLDKADTIYPRWFAASKTPYAALGGGTQFSSGGYLFYKDKPEGGYLNFPGPGEKWNCKTDAQLEQTCGEVALSAGNMADQHVVAIRFVQNISSNTVASVEKDVIAKYGPYTDSFDVVLGNVRAKHYVWGQPIAPNVERNGLRDLTDQNKAWQLSAIVAQVETNRVVLIIQMAELPDSEKTGAANASRPKL